VTVRALAGDEAGYPFNRRHSQTLYRELAAARAVVRTVVSVEGH